MNSSPKPQEQAKDNYAVNPEIKNELFTPSPSTNSIILQKDQVRSIYQYLISYNQDSKHQINTKDQSRKKCYSSANDKTIYDIDKKQGQIRKNNDQTIDERCLKKRMRRQKVCRSAENRQLSIPPEQQDKLFNRITIHCLKAKRQAVENSSKQVESEYSFVLKKIANLKRSRQLQHFKQQRISKIKHENRKMSEQLHKNHVDVESRTKEKKQELRKQIMAHRSCRKKVVLKKMQDNFHSASEQRLFSKDLHDRIEDNFWHNYQHKKSQCLKQRKDYQKRQLMKSRKLQAKKLQARKHFRNRWVHELQRVEQAEEQLVKKQTEIKERMSQAIKSYNQLLNKH